MKTLLPQLIEKAKAYLEANRITLIVWALIVVVIVAAVSANRADKAQTRADLTSSNPTVRQNEVLRLANSQSLADVLTDTEDPNSPATSPANVKSAALRESAANTLDDLIKAGKITAPIALDNLFLLRKDTDSGVDTAATNGLAMVGQQSNANLRMIVSRLSDGDPDVRSAAADALGKIGGSTAASLVAPLMSDPSAADAAQSALTKIGKPSIPYLTPMLGDTSLTLRTAVINTLAAIGDPSGIPALLAQVDRQPLDPTVHRMSIIALSTIVITSDPAPVSATATAPPAAAPAASAPVLSAQDLAWIRSTTPIFAATLVNTNEDSFARARSALALGRLGGTVAIAPLIKTLGDFDTRVANASCTAIQQVGPIAVPSLAAVTKSSDEAVRIAAAKALGGIANPAALAAIRQSLADPSVEVRSAAATALGTSENKDAVALLIPLLGDPSGEVASSAGYSLHLLGAAALPSLIASLGTANQAAAFYASQALESMGDPAEPALSGVLAGSGSDAQKIWAAVTLGELHDIKARPELTAAAGMGSPRLKWVASQALQQIGQA